MAAKERSGVKRQTQVREIGWKSGRERNAQKEKRHAPFR